MCSQARFVAAKVHTIGYIYNMFKEAVEEMEQKGEFPRRFLLTPRCVVWDLGEVEAWLALRRERPITPAKGPDVRLRRSRPVGRGRPERRPF